VLHENSFNPPEEKFESPWRRRLRLIIFTVLALLAAYILTNATLAWFYVSDLTHPPCQEQPQTIPGLMPPETVKLQTQTLEGEVLDLRAWYYPPQNGVAILALGGVEGALGENLPPVSFLVQEGYGALQIDSRMCALPSTQITLGADEITDVAAGLDFLLNQPEVEHIGAIGYSMGASAVVRAAARHPEIEAVIAEGGYHNLGDDIVKLDAPLSPRKVLLYGVASAYWLQTGWNPWQVSPIDDLAHISPRPLLLIYGEEEAASGEALRQFSVANEPKQLWIVPGGSHGKNYLVAPQDYRRRVLNFYHSAFGR
jgi:dipeptidyl aminopeptidase/acylaminoacyl peptidase